MLKSKTLYAIKALLHLSRKEGQGLVLISDIAEEERIPLKFLELILLELKRHGMLQSRKGKGGGYQLLTSARQLTLGQILRALEGPIALTSCASKTQHKSCDICRDEFSCSIKMVMVDLRDKMAQILDATSLADMAEKEKIAQSQGRNAVMYDI